MRAIILLLQVNYILLFAFNQDYYIKILTIFRGFVRNRWKDGYFILWEDSTIQAFKEKDEKKPVYTVRLKEVCQYLCVGPYTRCVPGRPELPSNGDENLLISFPQNSERKEKEICWIICKDLTQLK